MNELVVVFNNNVDLNKTFDYLISYFNNEYGYGYAYPKGRIKEIVVNKKLNLKFRLNFTEYIFGFKYDGFILYNLNEIESDSYKETAWNCIDLEKGFIKEIETPKQDEVLISFLYSNLTNIHLKDIKDRREILKLKAEHQSEGHIKKFMSDILIDYIVEELNHLDGICSCCNLDIQL